MPADLYARVDAYLEGLLVPSDPALDEALRESARAGLPDIQISPGQGQLLHVLARLVGARRILEVGTLAGYSTIWLARALPQDGELVTLELDPGHAEVARRNVERAGLAERVEIRVGAALESLAELRGPFDLAFLDADKERYPAYLEATIPLCRSGALIIADNVVRAGDVLAPTTPQSRGAAEFNAALAADPRLDATILQVVGAKGHDGIALARVR